MSSASQRTASSSSAASPNGASSSTLVERLRAVAAAGLSASTSRNDFDERLKQLCRQILPDTRLQVVPAAATRAERSDGSILNISLRRVDEDLGTLVLHRADATPFVDDDRVVAEAVAAHAVAALVILKGMEEQRGAEKARVLSDSRFRALFEQFPTSVQLFDAAGHTLEVNRAWCNLFGLTREHVYDFNPLVDPQLENIRPYIRRGFAGETITIAPHPFTTAPFLGEEEPRKLWLEVTICPIRDAEDEVREVIIVHHDVTGLKEAEEALRVSEASYRALFELANDATFVHDIETGAILDANRRACDLHGCTLNELKRLGVAGISAGYPPYDAEHARVFVQRAAAGEPQRFEWLVRDTAGEETWVEVDLHRVSIAGENRVLASVRNIKERKAAEQALQSAHDELERRVVERTAELAHAEHRFRAIVEASPVPLLLSRVDDSAILFANDRVEALIGVAPGSLLGVKTLDFYYDPADRPPIVRMVREQGAVRGAELRIKRSDGTPRWVSLSIQRLIYDGAPALATALVDITERIEAETTLLQQTEELEAIFRALPDLYFRMEADGTILAYRSGRSFGLYAPPEVFMGRKVQEVLPPPVGPKVGAALDEVARTGDLVHIEYILPLGDDPLAFEARLVPIMDGQVIAVVRNVTEQKEAEAALRASEESYRSLFDTLTELVYIQDFEGRFLNVNDAVVRAYGYSREELIGQMPDMLAVPGSLDPEVFAETFMRAVSGEPQRFEWWGRRKDGSTFPKEVVIQRSTYFGQDVVIAVARDVTAQKEAENALRASEEHFRRLIENASDLVQVIDAEGYIRYSGCSIVGILGYTHEELLGHAAMDYVHPADQPQALETFRDLIAHPGTSFKVQYRTRHKNGEWRVFESNARTLSSTSADAGIVINARDVTARVAAEQTLRFQKTLLEAQGEASIDGILVVKETGEILSYNRRFMEMWGIPTEVLASASDEAALQCVLDKLADPQAFLDRVAYLYAHPQEEAREEIVLNDGRVFDRYSAPVCSREGDRYGRIWFFRDITAQKRHAVELEAARQEARRYAESLEQSLDELQAAQDRLVHQEKMASLGRFTSGVAHEIKNPLNFVINFAELNMEMISDVREALRKAEADYAADLLDDVASNTEKIFDHGRRADAIIKGMMEHVRITSNIQTSHWVPVDLNRIIEEQVSVLMFYRKSAGAIPIQVAQVLGADVGVVEAVPHEISRVVNILLTNAFDAVEERSSWSASMTNGVTYRPTVTIHTSREGDRVAMTVTDNGSGISSSIRDRLFEPFVTMKPAGSGHPGLGLSLLHDTVVVRYGGSVDVESAEGEGATFTVRFPVGQ